MDFDSLAGEWLVVLPDHPDGASVASVLGSVRQRVDHPSGRPWLLGRWAPGDLRSATVGRRSVVVLGCCSATPRRLSEIAARTSDPVALDGLAWAGSFHLLASVDGVSRCQGSASGVRRVFRADVGGVTVAATRADVLAGIAGAGVDRGRLAARLLICDTPLTTLTAPLWTGVHAVDEDCCLLQRPDGRAVTRRRREPPADDHGSVPEAARALRTALAGSVQARLDSGRELTADLSGGLDSTTLCFLAGGSGRPLTAATHLGPDVTDEDALWADRAAQHLPGLTRLLFPFAEMPSFYSDVLEPGPRGDEPFPFVENRAIHRMLISRLRGAGSHMHMTGEGGDEVLAGGGVFGLVRRHPWTALRHLRANRAFSHQRWRAVAASAWERRDAYPVWLAKRARDVRLCSFEDLQNEEARVLRLPPWTTPEAAELVRDVLRADAETNRPHERNWTAHVTVGSIRQSGNTTRSLLPLYAQNGIQRTSPFLDENVVDACMTAPAHLRSTPWAYKNLLREAMRGIVPDQNLERATKAEASSVEHAGLRANAGALAALCDGSRLGRTGLIDPAALRATVTGLNFRMMTPLAISLTVDCERWLRDLETPAAGETPAGAAPTLSSTNGLPR